MDKIKEMKYSTNIQLFPSYFDLNDKIKPSAIMSIFQDIASNHGEKMGVGFEAMLQKKLYWIVSRVKYDVLADPKPYHDVIAETWPHEKGRVDFDRDYLIKDSQGNVLVKGTSKWCVISTETRKLELPTSVVYPEDEQICSDINYAERFVKTESVQRKEKADFVHQINFSEIDHNMHLNNVNYATFVFNTLKSSNIKHLQINFISECKYNDKLEVFKQEIEKNKFLISGYVEDVLKFSAYAELCE